MNSPLDTSGLPPLTPCIGVCRLDDDGYCVGCHRSMAEIAAWSSMDDAGRQRVMQVLDDRAERRQ